MLSIHGERKFSEEAKRENYHRVERNYGEFTRSIALPSPTWGAIHISQRPLQDRGPQ